MHLAMPIIILKVIILCMAQMEQFLERICSLSNIPVLQFADWICMDFVIVCDTLGH